MEFEFVGEVIEWRGPEAESGAIREVAGAISYGWGVIPVEAEVSGIRFSTSLFPRDGAYLLPLKDAVRRPAGIDVGDLVPVRMRLSQRG